MVGSKHFIALNGAFFPLLRNVFERIWGLDCMDVRVLSKGREI